MATVSIQRHEEEEKVASIRTRPGFGITAHLHLVLMCLFLGVVGISILYLAQFNDIATQGVIIDELESRRSQLIVENEVWRMRIAELSSLDVITQQPVVERMMRVEGVQYVE